MRGVIISAGSITDYIYIKSFINPDTDYIICADGGYHHAVKMGLRIDILLGDFDSISSDIPVDINKLVFDKDKDYTDTEIALDYARKQGFTEVLLLGGVGSRIDHTLANILMLVNFKNVVIINENNKIYMCDDLTIKEDIGNYVSLIPLTKCVGVTTKGLKYELDNATMEVGYGIGVSNVVTNENVSVNILSGKLLVIVAKD